MYNYTIDFYTVSSHYELNSHPMIQYKNFTCPSIHLIRDTLKLIYLVSTKTIINSIEIFFTSKLCTFLYFRVCNNAVDFESLFQYGNDVDGVLREQSDFLVILYLLVIAKLIYMDRGKYCV